MAAIAIPQPVNVNINQGFWNTSRAIRAACIVSGATLFLTSMAHNTKYSQKPEKLPYVHQIIEFVGKSIVERPDRCALAIGALSLTPEIIKTAKGIFEILKYCVYDQPIIGASIGSSALTYAAMTYGPLLTQHLKPAG